MSRSVFVSDKIMAEANVLLLSESKANRRAEKADMTFIREGSWLRDAAVIDLVCRCNGRWNVHLVFASAKNPLQFIVRRITACFSKSKADTAAFYMRKDAAKDARGTVTISPARFRLCSN